MKQRTRGMLLYTAAALVLASVAALYLSPHLAIDLAARVWACF